ncbi:putative Ig domain-containing protein, partial [Singulisphaera rosea]
GATIDAKTGLFSWTPDASTALGSYTISVVATDSGSPALSGTQSFTINVLAAAAVNHAPVIAAIPNQSVTQNQTLSLAIASFTTDSDTPTQTLRYDLGADAPAGVSLNSSTGILTWTPSTSVAAGTYAITVNATDNGTPVKTGSRTFFVKVAAVTIPVDMAPVIQSVHTQLTFRGFTITLKFSADLDPATATNVDNYILRMPGRDRRWGTGDDKIVPVVATYNASDRTVTLTTVGRLNLLISLFTPFQLTVMGNSPGNVTGANGKLLDGNHDGQPGGNYSTTLSTGGFFFGRSSHVKNFFPRFRQSGRHVNALGLFVPNGPETFFKSRHSRP